MTGLKLIALCMASAALGGALVNLAWIHAMKRRDDDACISPNNPHHLCDHSDHTDGKQS